MFCLDTSSLVAYLAGESGRDVDVVEIGLSDGTVLIPPPVISEILSDPNLPKSIEKSILNFPRVEILEDFWLRVAKLRRKLIKKSYKARLADCMIAQICIDHSLILLTRDSDFKRIAKCSELKLF